MCQSKTVSLVTSCVFKVQPGLISQIAPFQKGKHVGIPTQEERGELTT